MDSTMNINDDLSPKNKINDNVKYKTNDIIWDNPKLKRKINNYMRQSLYQDIKDQGIYSETDEESGDDSIKNKDILEEIKRNEKDVKDLDK